MRALHDAEQFMNAARHSSTAEAHFDQIPGRSVLSACPLVVDLDGTLIRTNMLHESVCRLFLENPGSLWRIPYWLWRGKALLKQQMALHTTIDLRTLPFNRHFLAWLQQQRAQGRRLILCTASDGSIARAIAEHLGIFDEVMASDGTTNLAGPHKAEALEQRFGPSGFDYAGNSRADLAVWQRARRAVIVNPSAGVAKRAASCCEVERVFPSAAFGFTTWRRVLRMHQWLKNLLLFVPVIAAHQITNLDAWLALILAFCSFSLCASSVYIANDLRDLESDRQHPVKGDRPFASGLIPVWMGFLLAPLLLVSSLALARQAGGNFFPWLLVYVVLTFAYTLGLKRLLLIDCLTLAMLYTLRIVAGAAATGIGLSFWLLAFSSFLFLSLAFVKRYAELQILSQTGQQNVHGRAYCVSDAPLIQTFGIASGYAAVLVLALYLNSDTVMRLYRTPEFLWGVVPTMVFWITWMWTQAHRGHLHEDAIVFALKDPASLLAGVVLVALFAIGAMGWPW